MTTLSDIREQLRTNEEKARKSGDMATWMENRAKRFFFYHMDDNDIDFLNKSLDMLDLLGTFKTDDITMCGIYKRKALKQWTEEFKLQNLAK